LEIDVRDYHTYVNETLGLGTPIDGIRDQRKRPEITAPVVFRSVLYGVSFGLGSLLGIDTFVKTHDLGSLLGQDGGPLLSDSTMGRSLSGMKGTSVADLVRQAAGAVLGRAEFIEAGKIGRFRVAAIDKSTLAGMPVVVARMAGMAQDRPVNLDYEPVRSGENEVTAAKRLIPRVIERFGAWIDVFVFDGLYTEWCIKLVRSLKKHVVVKTREKALLVTQKVDELAATYQRYGVEPIPGVDEDGYKEYRLMDFPKIEDETLGGPIRVVRVWEERLKGEKEKDEYHLLTTLSPQEAPAVLVRQIGRGRWGIENGCFRQTSQNLNGKHRFAGQGEAPEVMAGILLLAGTLLAGYLAQQEHRQGKKRSKKQPVKSVMRWLGESVPLLPQAKRQARAAGIRGKKELKRKRYLD